MTRLSPFILHRKYRPSSVPLSQYAMPGTQPRSRYTDQLKDCRS